MTEYTYPSSSGSKTYTVKLNDNGLLSCDCLGWTMKRAGKPRHCKHTKDVAIKFDLVLNEVDDQMFVASAPVAAVLPKPVEAPKTVTTGYGKDGFFTKVEAAPKFVKPMLASKLPDGFDADTYNSYTHVMEEKFDGHRLVTRVAGDGTVKAWSRIGNERTLPVKIARVMAKLPAGLYDGELIVPGNKSYGVTAGQNSGQEVLVLFDMLEVLGNSVMGKTYDERREFLVTAMSAMSADTAVIRSEQMKPSQAAVEAIWARGGEGAIIKRRTSTYKPDFRTGDWVKVKAVAAATLTIIGFEDGKSGPYSAVQLRDEHGIETTVKTLNNATLTAIAADPQSFIGKRLVISYQEKTPTGKFRHPMWDHLAGVAE